MYDYNNGADGDDLYEFRDLYLKMSEDEQQRITAVMDEALSRLRK